MNVTASVVQGAQPSPEQTAPKVDTIPTELAGVVSRVGDELVVGGRPLPVATVVPHTLLQLMLLVPGFFAVLFLIVLSAELESLALMAGTLLTMITGLLVSGGALVAHALWFAIGTSIGFGPKGYRTRVPLAWRRTTSRLVLRGEVGHPLQITGDHGTVFEQLPRASGPWQVPHLFWLAHRVAEQMGVPLEIDLDEARWNRWAVDPTYRAQVAFESRVASSQAEYRSWYRVPAWEPEGVRYEPEGLVWRNVMLEKRGLRAQHFGIAWSHVHDAEVELYEYAWSDHNGAVHQETRARLLVFTHDDVKELLSCTATPQSVGELFWMRDHVRDNAGRHVEHRGTEADVPEELLAARKL